jgi:hypothetical protein
MDDALTIIQGAADRGACQMDLVKAAAACLRTVVPLASSSQHEVSAALNAVEQWAARPSALNANNALQAAPNLDGLQERDITDVDAYLLLASAMAALAAANADFSSLTAVFAVEYAQRAAEGREIDLAPLVTAELL